MTIRNPFNNQDICQVKARIYDKMRDWLVVDWSYTTDEIQEKSKELGLLIEKEQIKLMKMGIKM